MCSTSQSVQFPTSLLTSLCRMTAQCRANKSPLCASVDSWPCHAVTTKKKRSWTPSGCPPSLLSLLLSTNRRRGTVTHTHTRTQSTTAADLRSFSAPASLIEHVHANDVTSTDDAYYFAKFRPVSQKCFN